MPTIPKHNHPRVSILGCGWFGLPLATLLVRNGYSVRGSTTSAEKVSELVNRGIDPYVINASDEKSLQSNAEFFDSDILIITIPPGLRSNRTAAQYLNMITAIATTAELSIKYVLYTSSTSVFADVNDHVNENSTPNPDTDSGKVVFMAEQLLTSNHHFQTTILRFAGMVGPGRLPGRFFSGKQNIPNGRSPVNLIHLDDCCNLALAIIQSLAFGYTIHACTPDHPEKQRFYTTASAKAGLSEPHFIDELVSWKIIDCLQPTTLLNYQFRIRNWAKWLEDPS